MEGHMSKETVLKVGTWIGIAAAASAMVLLVRFWGQHF
jgi:hypothetical protein